MSRYTNGYSTTSTTNGKSANGFTPAVKAERHDERASQSGSEDGSYGLYNDQHKIDADIDEESNALISQTLNADGTPKRPMNAFMIFARRRRPQVSAENQAMRTGEISKILSKEWVSMPPSEKQFYLEQAKQLKETFNSKYPDYVYRRRPNNSRKRRRSDSAASVRTAEQGALADGQHPDDMGGFDLDGSPTDGGDDHLDGVLPPGAYQHPHPHPRDQQHLPQHSLVDHSKYGLSGGSGGPTHARGPHPYPPPPDPPFRTTNGHHTDARLSYSAPGASDRMTQQPMGSSPRMGLSGGSGGGVHYSPYGAQSSSSPFGMGSDLLGSTHQGWQPRTERIGSGSSWLGGSPEATRLPAPIGGPKVNGYSSSWSETANGGNPSSSSPANFFPTLNTPFYPGAPPHHSQFPSNAAAAAAPSPATTIPPLSSPPSHFEGLGGIPSNPLSREFGSSRSYAASSAAAANNNVQGAHPFSLPSARDSFSFSQRSLPPVQTGGYAHSQPSSSSSGSGHGHAPPVFWRD